MKKSFVYILLAALTVGVAASCDLNQFPHDSISYQEGGKIFTNANDITSYRTNLYGYFRALNSGTGDNYITADEVMCDGFNATVDYGNNLGGIHRTDQSFTPGDYYVESLWATSYYAIKDFNIVIDGAYNVDKDLKVDADYVKAEAFFFRAATYLNLARHFGKDYDAKTASNELCVPLVLKYNVNELPKRATVAEVYKSIKSDLDSAAVVLDAIAGEVASGDVTCDALYAMYARYYLDVDDYENAAKYAELVMNSAAGYTFSATAADLENTYVNDNGTEAIFQMYASLTETSSSRDYWAGFGKTDKTAEGFAYFPYYLPTKKLIDAYDVDDYRLLAWFDKGTYAVRIGGKYASYDDFYVFTKYKGNSALNSAGYPNGYNAIKPFLISEMYLIDAEANFNAGHVDIAKASLNALQTARHSTTSEATLANIQNEWFKETVGEGLRMSCLKRWNLGFSARTAQEGALKQAALMTSGENYDKKTLEAGDYHFQWPIPSYEMKVNSNLIQNSGYTDAE